MQPQDETSDEYRASLPRISAELVKVETELTAAIQRRAALTLMGSDPERDHAHSVVIFWRLEKEQLEALRTAVAERLPLLLKAERVTKLRPTVEPTNALTLAFDERVRAEYPTLAAVLASLLADSVEAEDARRHCQFLLHVHDKDIAIDPDGRVSSMQNHAVRHNGRQPPTRHLP